MFIITSYYQIIPICSSLLSIIGYIPEIYSLCYTALYKKSINPCISNSIWAIWVLSALSGASYSYLIKEFFIMGNFIVTASLCIIIFSLKSIQPKQLLLSNIYINHCNVGIDNNNIITNTNDTIDIENNSSFNTNNSEF